MRARIAVLLAACLLPLQAVAAVDEPALTAPGELTVSGPGGSYLSLDVPRDAVMDLGPLDDAIFDYIVIGSWRTTGFRDVEFEGSGPWQGVALVTEGPPPPPGVLCGGLPKPECPPIAMAVRQEDVTIANGRWGFVNLGFQAGAFYGQIRVPAGRYRLYLIGDEANQRATVRFGGLEGTAQVTATGQGVIENRYLDPRLDLGTGQRTVQSFGTTYTTGEHAVAMLGLAVSDRDGSRIAGAEWGLCLYLDDHPEHEEVAYLPTCPAGWTSEGDSYDISGGDRWTREPTMWVAGAQGAGKQAWGWWYASHGPASRATAPYFHLDLS